MNGYKWENISRKEKRKRERERRKKKESEDDLCGEGTCGSRFLPPEALLQPSFPPSPHPLKKKKERQNSKPRRRGRRKKT